MPFLEEDPNDDLPTEEEWTTPCAEQKNEMPALPDGALLWDSFENEVTATSSATAVRPTSPSPRPATTCRRSATASPTTSSPRRRRSSSRALLRATVSRPRRRLDRRRSRRRAVGSPSRRRCPPEVDWKDGAAARARRPTRTCPTPATAPARPATDVPFPVDLDAITVPDAPTAERSPCALRASASWPVSLSAAGADAGRRPCRRRARSRARRPAGRASVSSSVECDFDHFGADDPIVHPGHPGRESPPPVLRCRRRRRRLARRRARRRRHDVRPAGRHGRLLGAGAARRRRRADRRRSGRWPTTAPGPTSTRRRGRAVSARADAGGRRLACDRAATGVGRGVVVRHGCRARGDAARLHGRAEPADDRDLSRLLERADLAASDWFDPAQRHAVYSDGGECPGALPGPHPAAPVRDRLSAGAGATSSTRWRSRPATSTPATPTSGTPGTRTS